MSARTFVLFRRAASAGGRRARPAACAAFAFVVSTACAPRVGAVGPGPVGRAAHAAMIEVPAGPYVAGSTDEEREQAYRDAHERARAGRWFAREEPRHDANLPSFHLDRTHVTNRAYAEFVVATGRSPPRIGERDWLRQGYVQDYATHVRRYHWTDDGRPPDGREDHPVLLVTHHDAAAYCAWRGARLPSAAELEKASRGHDGRAYPWGDAWNPERVVAGDTEPVGSRPSNAGPYGHLDLAGQAFHWTSSPWSFRAGEFTVKGSAWDDRGGVGRGASRHGRPAGARHAIVGFRCAR